MPQGGQPAVCKVKEKESQLFLCGDTVTVELVKKVDCSTTDSVKGQSVARKLVLPYSMGAYLNETKINTDMVK